MVTHGACMSRTHLTQFLGLSLGELCQLLPRVVEVREEGVVLLLLPRQRLLEARHLLRLLLLVCGAHLHRRHELGIVGRALCELL